MAAHIWWVVEGCLAGDAGQRAEAGRLLAAAGGRAPGRLEVAAGWDAIRRNAKPRDGATGRLLHEVMGLSTDQHPLVSSLLAEFPARTGGDIENADVLTCQHLMGSVVAQFTAIRDLLPGAQFWDVLGKPYSASLGAVEALEEVGFVVDEESCRLPERRRGYDFGAYQARHKQVIRNSVARFFERHGDRTGAPIVVIDDGGSLVGAVGARAIEVGCTRPIVCIEQTQRGINSARTFTNSPRSPAGGFTMINVAQSLSKLVLEAPLIAESVLDTTLAWLDHAVERGLVAARRSPLRVGLIGYGAVGESIATATSSFVEQGRDRLCEPVVYDRNLNRLAAARRRGHEVARSVPELLGQVDLVFAAAGGASIDDEDARFLRDGTVLVSASSGDSEFKGVATWALTQHPVLRRNDLTPFDDVHGLIEAELPSGDGRVLVLNGGFPVNFDGSLDPIPPARIQLTRALMVAGVLHAKGFEGGRPLVLEEKHEVALDAALDGFLEREFGSSVS